MPSLRSMKTALRVLEECPTLECRDCDREVLAKAFAAELDKTRALVEAAEPIHQLPVHRNVEAVSVVVVSDGHTRFYDGKWLVGLRTALAGVKGERDG